MVMIELRADNLSLILEGPHRWCKVCIRQDGTQQSLGAGSLDNIVPRLCYGLEERGLPTSGEIDGIPTEHILSLSEEHHTFYMGWMNQHTKMLFIQDSNGQVRARIRLNGIQRKEWAGELRNADVSKGQWAKTMEIFKSSQAWIPGDKNKA